MKKFFVVVGLLLLVGAGGWYFFSSRDVKAENPYQFAEIKRGNLESVVTSTGTLDAVRTVEVGTQVSGTIDRVLVDYNDKVHKGQLLAVLETDVLQASVQDAQAGVDKARAQLKQAESDLKRNQELFQKGYISAQDMLPYQTGLETARASLVQAQATLDRARTNLANADIYSPINGTVIERNVDAGQTVASSFSTPKLFTIAEDLSRMQILASVDESDIGQIKDGQPVRFTVQAYPDENFSGTVRQIRLEPTTVQNVVQYTVVIDANNENGHLLPGMTATVNFIVEKVDNALLVPNTAIRFRPTSQMFAEFQKTREARFSQLPDSVRQKMRRRFGNRAGGFGGRPGGFGGGGGEGEGGTLSSDSAHLWYLDKNGNLEMARIRTGATDGQTTQIVMGRDIHEGMQVITGLTQPDNEQSRPHFRRRLF